MPKTIEGWVDEFSQTQDWVANFSVRHTGGTMWLGVKTQGPNQAFAEKIRQEVRQLKEEERSLWRIEYDETEKEKNGKVYTNRTVASAKIVTNTPTPAPAAQQATSKDDSIARAVAYKGAIDLVAKSGPIAEYIKRTVAYKGAIKDDSIARDSRGSVWESILLTANCTSALMNAGELMLQHEYSPEKMMLIIQKYSQGSGDDAQLEVVDAGQDTLFDTDNPI